LRLKKLDTNPEEKVKEEEELEEEKERRLSANSWKKCTQSNIGTDQQTVEPTKLLIEEHACT
jgi:hypothetical protein